MSELIDRNALIEKLDGIWDCNDMVFEPDDCCDILADCKGCKWRETKEAIKRIVLHMPTIDAVPVKFIDEVIEYLTKCRDCAIHEETKTTWDEQRQTLIMLLHEWAAWNECGRTGKYGERREE